MFFSPADCSFVPTVCLLKNDTSQPVAGCNLPHTNHVFLPNMLCPTQPVAGCISPHKHVFLPNMFFPIHTFLWSNCVFAGKRQFATSCGVYLSTETCFLTKHVFPIHSFVWSNCVFAGKRQFATSCGVYLSTNMFSYQTCFSNPYILLVQLCLCWKTTIRNQLRGVSFHTNMFSYQTCFFQSIHSFGPTVSLLENDNSQPVAGCIFPQKHVFLPNMFFQSIHSFGPPVFLLENDNSQPVAGCIFPQKHVFLPNMFFQPIRSFVPTVSLLENDNSQPVAGCIFPHKHVFLLNMFFPIHTFFWSNCVFAGKRQFATSCGVYLSTQTCFLTKHVFSNPYILLVQLCLCWKTTIRNQLRGVSFHTNMFSYQTCFFQSIHSFVPTVSLLENDNSQPVAGCIFSPQSCILTKHVFSKPFVLLFQVCLCRKAIIRNQLRRAFYTIMFPHKCVSLFGNLKSRCRFA